GYSGVDPVTVDLLVGMLNHSVHPIVREVGSVGASGDLVELAQIALAMIGEGLVDVRGIRTPAATALRAAGLEPLQPRYREALGLMTGTSFHPGAAAVLLARSQRLLSAAQVAAAMMLEALRGNMEAFDSAVYTARPHPGARTVVDAIHALVTGSHLVRTG